MRTGKLPGMIREIAWEHCSILRRGSAVAALRRAFKAGGNEDGPTHCYGDYLRVRSRRGGDRGIEALGMVGDLFGLASPFWQAIAALNEHFAMIGYLIIAIFVVSWIAAAVI
jgi:hypothetical protein